MMDHQKPLQPSLFYKFNLDQRVAPDHPLRIIAGLIDFDFIYDGPRLVLAHTASDEWSSKVLLEVYEPRMRVSGMH